jgi:hypothetical protein
MSIILPSTHMPMPASENGGQDACDLRHSASRETTQALTAQTRFHGTRGGTAVARTLFGDVNPSSKLPVTWPRSVGQVPIYYAHNITHMPKDQGKRYWDTPSTPQFEFGYGLSYTRFRIGAPTLDAPALMPGGKVTVSTRVTNTGDRAGDEVVQLYIHQQAGRASRPVRELKGFQRVTLKPGETRTVSFVLDEKSAILEPGGALLGGRSGHVRPVDGLELEHREPRSVRRWRRGAARAGRGFAPS